MKNEKYLTEYLSELRDSLDHLDSALIGILAERFHITEKVGALKAENNLPAIDKKRETSQFARIQKIAKAQGLDEEIAQKMLRLIIDEVVIRHKKMQEQK